MYDFTHRLDRVFGTIKLFDWIWLIFVCADFMAEEIRRKNVFRSSVTNSIYSMMYCIRIGMRS